MAVTRDELLRMIGEKLGQSAGGGQQRAQSAEKSDEERARYKALAEKEYQRVQSVKKLSGTYNPVEREKAQRESRDALVAADNEAIGHRKNAALAQKEYDDYVKSPEYRKKQENIIAENFSASESPTSMPQLEDNRAKELKARANYFKNLSQQADDSRTMEWNLRQIDPKDEEAFTLYTKLRDGDASVSKNNDTFYDFGQMKEVAAPLEAKYGKENFKKLAEAYGRQYHAEKAAALTEQARKDVETVPGAIGGSALSVVTNMFGGVSGLMGRFNEMRNRTGQFRTLEPYTEGDMASLYGNAARGAVAENIAGDGDSKVRTGLSKVYEAGMSAVDSVARAAAFGSGSLALVAASSFTSALSEASQKGATPEQAFLMATANAGLEVLTEKVSLDALLDKAKAAGGSNLRKVLLNTFGQAGVEISEEEVSYIGGLIAEAAILRGNSEYNQTIGELVANGMSYEEAKAQADKNVWNEAVNTAVVSGLSGAMSGAGATAYSEVMTKLGNRRNAQASQQEAVESPQVGVLPETSTDTTNTQSPDVEAANELTNALNELSKTGRVTDRAAKEILFDLDSMRQLQEQAGLDLSQQDTEESILGAIKAAVRQMAGDAAPSTLNPEGARSLIEDMGQELAEKAPPRQETPEVTPERQAAQAAFDRVLGVDTGTEGNYNQLNENPTQGGTENGTGLQENDRAGSIGNSETGLAGVQQGNGTGNQGRGQSGEMAVDSGELRVSDKQGGTKNGTGNGGVQRNTENNPSGEIAGGGEDGKGNVRSGDQGGVSGGVREGALHTSDSEGRKLTREQAARLQNSAVVDDKGSPIAVYHSTDNMDFDTFTKGDVGFHFGTADQAEKRSADKGSTRGRTFRAYLDIKNPFRADLDIMGWKADGASLYLWSRGVLTDAESQEIQSLSANGTGYDSPASVRLREILEGKGYDGISYPNGFEGAGDSYIAFRDDQIIRSEVTNFGSPQAADSSGQSTGGGLPRNPDAKKAQKGSAGTPERNFTGTAAYDDLLSDDNVQSRRASDAKNVEVPKVDAYGRDVSESAHNLMNSDIISDRDIDTAKRLIQEGAFGHETQSMDDVRDTVYAEIQKKGLARSVGEVSGAAAKGKLSEYDIAKAEVLLAMVTDKKGTRAADYASDLMVTLGQMATQSGRQLNMFKLFRKMTPEGQLMTVQKSVKNNVEKMIRSGQVKKGFEATIDPELEQDYLNAAKEAKTAKDPQKQKEAQQRMKDAEDAIYVSVAAQMPATKKAKWDAWRYMCMLGNVRTQARNLVGNAAFIPYKTVKDKMGALMELAIPQEQRTKALLTDRELLQWAKQDAKSDVVQDALKYSGKLGDDVTGQKLFDNRKIFNSKTLETIRQVTQIMPEAGDMIFKNPYYAKSLAGFLTARGYSVGDITSGKVSDTVLDAGRAYAIDEAMKATFNDCNAFSDLFATTLRYKGDSPAGKVANLLAEGIMPFRRTPANIVVRFTEYSPVGLVKGLVNTARSIAGGKVTASTAIDQLSAGLTGTAAMALGGLLASGIGGIRLTGSDVDDDEKRRGHQTYALEFSIGGKDYSYKIDWAAPANLPLFVGANIYNLIHNSGEDVSVSKFTAFLRGMGTMLEPMLSLSCLSSLNDVIQSGRYAEDGGIVLAVLSNMATSYFTQGIPTLARQASQFFQENKQTTFANSADPTIRDIQKEAANIPFLGNRYKTDKINAWGEKEKNGVGEGVFNWLSRAFDTFTNPGTLKQIDDGALETEIARLNDAQEENVSPPEANKVVSYTDKNGEVHKNYRLTEEEYQTLATVQGQTANRIVSQMIGSKEYTAMTDQQKAQAVKLAYEYAKAKGLSETFSDYAGMDGWKRGIDGKESEAIFRKIATSEFSKAFDAMEPEALDQAYGLYKSLPATDQADFRKETGGRVGYYITAKENGVSDGVFTDLYGTYKALDGNEGMADKQKAQEWSRTLAEAYEDGRITKAGHDALKEKMVFRQSYPIDTEKFDAMTESGLSSDVADQIIKGLADLQGTGSVNKDTGKATVTNPDRWGYIAALDGLSDKERDRVMLLYMPDYDPEAEKPNKTELKYAYLRSKGYSAEQFTQTYNVTKEYSKKADMIAAWVALGYSSEEAQMFYKLYKGGGLV